MNIFSGALIERYQKYMRQTYGVIVEPEQAQRDLARLADLYALVTSSKVGSFPVPRPAPRGGAQEADRRED